MFETLADGTARRALRSLLQRGPTSVAALARELAADEAVASSDPGELHLELRHVRLPAMASVSLVRWDREGGTLRPSDHPALEDDALRRTVASDAPVDDVLEALADDRRRLVLAVLHAYGGPIDRQTVRQRVAELEAPGSERDPEPDGDLGVALAHVHVPKLADAGLVRGSTERGTLEYLDHPDVEPDWFTL